jgi:thiamine kinase-like enzyme
MSTPLLDELVNKFDVDLMINEITPFGNGHINDTYLVKTFPVESPDYMLQRKNHKIFKDIQGMMKNIVITTKHIRKKLIEEGEKDVSRKVMTYIPSKNGPMYVNDNKGNFWTLFLYIDDCCVVENIHEPQQAYLAAQTFGHFQLQLADLSGEELIETIPNFHNGISRLFDFQLSVLKDEAGRVSENQQLINKISERAVEMTELQRLLDDKTLPLRITHNDTKINNILFDQDNNTLCVIDLDTVMPGSALYDFGDAIRTLGNRAPEDEQNHANIAFNKEIYEAFTQGYLSEAKAFLLPIEIGYLAFSCRYMAWEQATRFMTDYLNGDKYYKTDYQGHNLIRTMAQIRYLEVLEENKEVMENIVKGCV